MISGKLWTCNYLSGLSVKLGTWYFAFKISLKEKNPHILRNVTELMKTEKAEVPGTWRNGEDGEK